MDDELEELRAEVDAGIADADAGRFVQFTAEDIIAEGMSDLKKVAREANGNNRATGS